MGSFLVPGLTILHHPDAGRVGERVALAGLASGREESLSRTVPAFSAPGKSLLRPLSDPYLSRRPIRLLPGAEPGGVLLRCGESGTALVADGAAVTGDPGDLEIPPARLERGVVLLLAGRVVLLLSRLDPVGVAGTPDFGLVGASAPVVALRREIQRVAGLDVPVLLRGETGTGKELVARALHDAGPRRSRPFVAVNMAAIPPTLAAAELFGAARGAFTGADRKRDGTFQRADGGTLFLDEVGETPPEIQALLLRALETGEIQPVGSDEIRRVDVRLVAATDSDLEGAVTAGRFRAPLLHRLAGYPDPRPHSARAPRRLRPPLLSTSSARSSPSRARPTGWRTRPRGAPGSPRRWSPASPPSTGRGTCGSSATPSARSPSPAAMRETRGCGSRPSACSRRPRGPAAADSRLHQSAASGVDALRAAAQGGPARLPQPRGRHRRRAAGGSAGQPLAHPARRRPARHLPRIALR